MEIIQNLYEKHDFINLDVKKLKTAEIERGTAIGEEFMKVLKNDKTEPASLVVRMLNKIIYCGQKNLNKFMLTNFPEHLDQVKEFEDNCARISAVIYPNGPNSSKVELHNSELRNFSIASFFQKEFRLKTMDQWSF